MPHKKDEREIAVSVKDIHKEFNLPQSKSTSLKQLAVNMVRSNNKVTQKVLDGVSFDVYEGDFFGIVGRNGSGKSTLLKLLAGVYTPTSGEVYINGGLTPFIELGVGFNPELSGRDNVYLNGALLGFNRKQMDEMYDEIVDFAELGPFMDQKLKNYSSGMQVRLAFSIAIKAKNEVLIFDEVLAVGDEAFQRKCLDVFEQYKAEGQTVILVTHDMKTVKEFCSRAVLINDGKVLDIGLPAKIADKYSELNIEDIKAGSMAKNKTNGIHVELKNSEEEIINVFKVGSQISMSVKWDDYDERAQVVMIDIYKMSGEHITTFKSVNQKSIAATSISENKGVNLSFGAVLTPGKYRIDVSLLSQPEDTKLASVYDCAEFIITDDYSEFGQAWSGLVPLEHEWSS